MARWIAFDQETTSLLRTQLAQGTMIEVLRRGPVDYALARPSAVVAVLPATGTGGPGIAVFRRARPALAQRPAVAQSPMRQSPEQRSAAAPQRAATLQPVPHRAATRATGFLGLTDEPVFEEERVQEKKGWWRKFWDE
jgi:hypothetical protein